MFENDDPIGYGVMAVFWITLLLSGSWWLAVLLFWVLVWRYAP